MPITQNNQTSDQRFLQQRARWNRRDVSDIINRPQTTPPTLQERAQANRRAVNRIVNRREGSPMKALAGLFNANSTRARNADLGL